MTNIGPMLLTAGIVAVRSALAADSHAAGTPSPARVANPIKETSLTTVTLEPTAESRLGIQTVAVAKKSIHRARRYAGTIVLPVGRADSAAGTNSSWLAPEPPASTAEALNLAERQAAADSAVRLARVQSESAEIALRRAETLLETETGSQRAVDEARAAGASAESALDQALQQRSLLGTPISPTAPLARVWVRVPVYVGDVEALDRSPTVEVGEWAARPGAPTRSAHLVSGPPSANPEAATVDWFFELDAPNPALHVGQRVGVAIPLREPSESLVVPWAAVLHDQHGGEWVYEATAPQTYARRRIQVAYVVGQDAVLVTGPPPGVRVVTAGAAELFGTEFGVGK